MIYEMLATDVANVLELTGTPDEVGKDQDAVDLIAGYQVAIHSGGQHNGRDATVMNLTTDGGFEVGRLVIRDDAKNVIWHRSYEEPGFAEIELRRFNERKIAPKVVTTTELDMAYDEDTLAEAIVANVTRWGVSTQVLKENGPAGGWPVVTYTGTYEAVLTMLTDKEIGYGFTDEEVREVLAF